MKMKSAICKCLFLMVLITSGCQGEEAKNLNEEEDFEQVKAEEQEKNNGSTT